MYVYTYYTYVQMYIHLPQNKFMLICVCKEVMLVIRIRRENEEIAKTKLHRSNATPAKWIAYLICVDFCFLCARISVVSHKFGCKFLLTYAINQSIRFCSVKSRVILLMHLVAHFCIQSLQGKVGAKAKRKCGAQNKNLTKTTYVGYLLPEVFLQERCYRRNYDFKVVAIRSVDAVGSGTIFKHPESVETFPGRQVLPPQISFNRYITGSFTSPMLSSCLYIHIFLTVPKIHL